jgi:putative heme iron utilization protein
MKSEDLDLLQQLLGGQRVLALAVLVDGAPYVGLLPFALERGYGSLLIHASDLALHSRGLAPDAPFSALIQAPDSPERDPLQIPRVTLQGRVEVLERGGDDYEQGKTLYTTAFPASQVTFGLGDFRLYRLKLEKGRLIGGFARAATVSPAVLEELESRATGESA